MITTAVCFLALGDKLAVGQKFDYTLTWHYKGKETDSTDEESLGIEVTKVLPDSITIQVVQKLLATIIDGNRIPTDPKAVPAKNDWALFPNHALAFMTPARFGLETRFYRIFKGVMPAPKGDPERESAWTVDVPEDGKGVPKAAIAVRETKRLKEGRDFFLSYREVNGTNGLGHFVRSDKHPFPVVLEVHFMNTTMPGGTDVVDCDFTMRLKPEK